jgi:hypothetical protein
MTHLDSESSTFATSVASNASQPPLLPIPPTIVFIVPTMNHNLSIKLSKGNFNAWKTHILAYIKGQDAYGFLDGSSMLPAQTIPNPSIATGALATIVNPDFLAWNQLDQMILSILISTLSEPYVVHAVVCASDAALWNTFLTMFASQARACIMQIYFQLATVKKDSNSITEYFQTIKTLIDTLIATGQPLNDFESVSFLLKGLRTDPFVTSVTTRFDPLSIDELYGHLLANEMHLDQQLPAVDVLSPAANFTTCNSPSRGHGYCGRGGSPYNQGCRSYSSNHGRSSYFSQDATSPTRPSCQICGKPGHSALRCYHRHDMSFSEQTQPPQQ